MARKRTGRPTKKDQPVVAKLIEGFQNDFTVLEACHFACIDKATYYRWCEKDPSFATEMARARSFPFILAKRQLFQHVKQGDKQCTIEFLKRRSEEYKDKQEVDNTVHGNLDVSKMSDEELVNIINGGK